MATISFIGTDVEAKQSVADVVTAGGLRVIDAGSLERARELEALGFLQITLAANGKIAWTGGFGVAA
jgi:8-hydroxy-5-deazaflavin:NADPH oxidoreductase